MDTPAPSIGALHGPVMAGHSRVYGHRGHGRRGTGRERARRATDIHTRRKIWVDAAGNKISGTRWRFFYKPGQPARGGGKAKRGRKGRDARGRYLKKGRKGAARGRQPSRKQIRRQIRKWPRQTVVTVYPRVSRGERIPDGAKRYTVRNPRRGGYAMARRRNNPGRRRRHNPGGMRGAVTGVTRALLPAAIGGAAAGLLDAKVTAGKSVVLRVGAKILAAALGGVFLRKNPVQSAAFMGAMVGSAAYEGGVRLGGGVIAVSRIAGIQQLAAMAGEDEVSLGLLQDEMKGMGLLTEMGDDDHDGLQEVEPDLGDDDDMSEVEPDLGDDDDMGDDDND